MAQVTCARTRNFNREHYNTEVVDFAGGSGLRPRFLSSQLPVVYSLRTPKADFRCEVFAAYWKIDAAIPACDFLRQERQSLFRSFRDSHKVEHGRLRISGSDMRAEEAVTHCRLRSGIGRSSSTRTFFMSSQTLLRFSGE